MPAYKDTAKGTWYTSFYFEDWKGVRKKKLKRGFETKKEALAWERQFLMQKAADLNMNFEKFVELYTVDKRKRLRENTWETKAHIIRTKILPYFKMKQLSDIHPRDIIAWQNELLNYRDENGKGYSQTYLKTLHNQLSAIFNHAVRYYGLKNNPAAIAGNMGSEQHKEMLFWTKEEYLKFSYAIMDKPRSFYAFEILYWCGIREGDDDDKIRLNQRKPSKYKGLSRFGPEKNLQRINKFMKERPTFYKKLIQMKENFRFYLRCFYCITKVVILQFNSEKQDRISS